MEQLAKRKDPNLTEKLAALIVEHYQIPREHAKTMTAKEIVGLLATDHTPVPFALARDLGWTPEQYNHPTNLSLIFHPAHQVKTATKDVPDYYKGDRIAQATAAHRAALAAKAGFIPAIEDSPPDALARDLAKPDPAPRSRLRSRGFQKGVKRPLKSGRKLQSRGFQKRETMP